MSKSYISLKIEDFHAKLGGFFQHRKKVKALENFALSGCFNHKKYLLLIKGCLDDGFLEEKEDAFLNHLINKYLDDYLFWAHRTKSVKAEIARLERSRPKPKPQAVQMYIDFDKIGEVGASVPTHLIIEKRMPVQRSKI